MKMFIITILLIAAVSYAVLLLKAWSIRKAGTYLRGTEFFYYPLEFFYLIFRLGVSRFQSRVLIFQMRYLRFQSRHLRFRNRALHLAQSKLFTQNRIRWNPLNYIRDYTHFVLLGRN